NAPQLQDWGRPSVGNLSSWGRFASPLFIDGIFGNSPTLPPLLNSCAATAALRQHRRRLYVDPSSTPQPTNRTEGGWQAAQAGPSRHGGRFGGGSHGAGTRAGQCGGNPSVRT